LIDDLFSESKKNKFTVIIKEGWCYDKKSIKISGW
jgi:hypothetical protein